MVASDHCHLIGVRIMQRQYGVTSMQGEYLVGRSSSCFHRLNDVTVSGKHATMSLEQDGKLLIIDLNSTNGTYVLRNGMKTRIYEEAVNPNDILFFGECQVPASKLIAHIHDDDGHTLRVPQPERKPSKPTKHIRCKCGNIRPSGTSCPICGDVSIRR